MYDEILSPKFFEVYCKKCFMEREKMIKGVIIDKYFFKHSIGILLKCSSCGFEWGYFRKLE
jgi:hypothetical protein